MESPEFFRSWIDIFHNDKNYKAEPKRKSFAVSKVKSDKRLVEFKDGDSIWTGVVTRSDAHAN